MLQTRHAYIKIFGLLIVLSASLFNPAATAQIACNGPIVEVLSPADNAVGVSTTAQLSWQLRELADDFEDGDLDEYTEVDDTANPTHTTTGAAAVYGNFGLSSVNTNFGLGWLVRDDLEVANARGSTISVWIHPHAANGRTYFGFGTTTTRSYAVELQSNLNRFVLSKWTDSLTTSTQLAIASQQLNAQWYRVEIIWGTNTFIRANLYDSDGTTILRTISAFDGSFASGGIAFRSFETTFSKPSYFDEVDITQPAADNEQYIPGPRSSWTTYPDEAIDIDVNSGMFRYPDTPQLSTEPTAQQTLSTGIDFETLVDESSDVTSSTRATEGGTCGGTVINFDDIPASGYTLWDGNRYANQGVVFSTTAGASLYAFNSSSNADTNPNYVLASTTGFISDSKIIATFSETVNCVSLYITDGEPPASNFLIQVFDSQNNVLETLIDNGDQRRYSFQHAGIKKLEFTPSSDVESIDSFQFTAEACPQTYDVYLGTEPRSMELIANGIEQSTFAPGPLVEGETYYWQVVSADCCGEYTSDLWSFTVDEPEPQPSSEVWIDFGFSNLELGTQEAPFNTIAEAMTYLITGGTLKFKGDSAATSTSETPTITTDATLEAVNGTIRIGVAP